MCKLTVLRSCIFQLLFYLSNAVQMIFWTPVFFVIPREEAWKIVRCWAWSHLWLQYVVIGSRYQFKGQENLLGDTGFILAAKHQSNWETYTKVLFLKDPTFVIKRELTYIPLFGWYMKKMNLVPVDRGKRGVALASMTKHSKRQFNNGRQIVIYPEGTRRQPGAEPQYKYGLVHLYHELGAPIVPMALNSGLYWPKKSFMVYPGTIELEFLPVIEPGLSKDAFKKILEERIETACNRMLQDAAKSEAAPPTLPAATMPTSSSQSTA